jgi:hypothetical protein
MIRYTKQDIGRITRTSGHSKLSGVPSSAALPQRRKRFATQPQLRSAPPAMNVSVVSTQKEVGAALGLLVGAVGPCVGESVGSVGLEVGESVGSGQGKPQVFAQVGPKSLPSSVARPHLSLFPTQTQSRVRPLTWKVPTKSKHSLVGELDGAGESVGAGLLVGEVVGPAVGTVVGNRVGASVSSGHGIPHVLKNVVSSLQNTSITCLSAP